MNDLPMDNYVLDSFAILALLDKEPGSTKVVDLLHQARAKRIRLLMTWVNVGEVAYIIERRRGKDFVFQVLGELEATQIEFFAIERHLALQAANIKANYPLAYADAFAAALAVQEQAILVTGDPEFKTLENMLPIFWLP